MSLSNTSTASAGSARGASNASPAKDKQLMRLVIQLLRPYRGWLLIVFIAMLVEIAMSLCGTLAAQARPRRCTRAPQAAGMACLGARLRLRTSYSRRRIICRSCHSHHCHPRGDSDLYRQLLHHERGAMDCQRFTAAHLRTPSSTVTAILRQRQDRHADVHHHQRCSDDLKFCLIFNARNRCRPDNYRLYGRVDVLA